MLIIITTLLGSDPVEDLAIERLRCTTVKEVLYSKAWKMVQFTSDVKSDRH